MRIELLRPLLWLEMQGAEPGGVLFLDLPEMGAQGFATVLDILPCPAIEQDIGEHRNVVTGRFIHQSSGNLIDLYVEGEPDPIGVTDNHRFWSVDRNEFVEAAELLSQEHLKRADGSTARVAGKISRPRDELVYNLEVHGEHVYLVGCDGILVHSTNAPRRGKFDVAFLMDVDDI